MPVNKTFRIIFEKLHLWLGLLSGIVIFIVCITGCLYVFKDEINDFNQSYKFVKPQDKVFLQPTKVLEISNKEISNSRPTAITYGESFDAVFVDYYESSTGMSTVYIDPYNGKVLKTVIKKYDDFDFFRFVLDGHRTLWLPRDIGKPIVGYGVLIFAVTLVTGMVLWWPKKWNKRTIKKNLTFRKKVPLSRINFDLHNVLGGYSVIVLLILSFTGLIWSFNWFSESVYYITSGGKELKPYTLPQSDTLNITNPIIEPLDKLYTQLKKEEPNATTFYFALPQSDDGVIRVSVVHERGSYYKTDNLFFDQYTLKPLEGSGPYAGKYTEVSNADKFRRMNLEIHDGRILGIWGKNIMFIVALIGASLPVTGFIIWYRKKKKKLRKA